MTAEQATGTSLRDRATAAYEEGLREANQHAREERRRAYEAQAATLKRTLCRVLGVEADAKDFAYAGEHLTYLLEGIQFTAREGRSTYEGRIPDSLHALCSCSKCGAWVASREITSLRDLGETLARGSFDPDWGHECPRPRTQPETPPPPTLEERLLEALREFVRAEGGQE